MQELPHVYSVNAQSIDQGVRLSSLGLDEILSAAPLEFGGPGDMWSPETLLAAAVADCFILSFKAIARASKFDWTDISCEVEAVLDRVGRKTCFTEIRVLPCLSIANSVHMAKAKQLLEKSEAACLITNSMTANVVLNIKVIVV
ncbi:MAG: organic hydroperoxide reductase OsmC/OhrA [Candidatus Azotimanducaceae bacterium]|jgi:organic hydroperoxide reductase OsmC/OhrA